MDAVKVLMMAGGTGGHVFPALAVADELRARGHGVEWLGVPAGIEAGVAGARGYGVRTIDYRTPRGQSPLGAALRLLRAVAQARRALAAAAPQLAIGMGGYASVPGGIAAWLRRTPLVIHEQNSLPGKANRLLARFARRVLTAYPGALAEAGAKVLEVGNPVRGEFARMAPPAERMAGRAGPLRLLVLGGSQGARFLNDAVPALLAEMAAPARPAVLHQCGRGNREAAERAYASRGVEAEVREFVDDVAAEMARADLFAGRSGAATLAEIAAAGLGALLFPYPHAAERHQLKNAEFFASSGAALVVEERDFDPARLGAELARIGRARALEMARAARAISRPDAAGKFADACEEAAGAA